MPAHPTDSGHKNAELVGLEKVWTLSVVLCERLGASVACLELRCEIAFVNLKLITHLATTKDKAK